MAGLIIGVLASNNAKDLNAVIGAIEAGELDAEIACVISDNRNAPVLERARKHGIEAIFVDPKGFDSAEEHDKKIVALLKGRNVGLALLIGYKRFLTAPFLNAFKNRAMNIHPSLLPAFKGWHTKVHRSVLDAGCKVSGCTLFFVTAEPDGGPIIAQKAVPLSENETVDSLREKVQRAEQEVILRGLRLFADGKLEVSGGKVRVK
jgi:phosphoribosylglycinamide formyltransferase-1